MSDRWFRLTMIVPEADCPDWNWWIGSAIDAAGGEWLAAGLSPTGQPPGTHRWFSAGLDAAEVALFVNRLDTLAGIPGPPSVPPDAVYGWFEAHTDEIQAALGIYTLCADNRGRTEQPEELLARAGLQPVAPAAGSAGRETAAA